MTLNKEASPPVVGRLAPSPTGLLHLGNAWAFLLAWLDARVAGGRVILRIEDIDPARSKNEWTEGIVRDLAWLGLDWDEGPLGENGGKGHEFYCQSQRGAFYEDALHRLQGCGLVYPCYCTRRELRELASAPHRERTVEAGLAPYSHIRNWVGDLGARYPGTCASLTHSEREQKEKAGRVASLRLRAGFDEAGNKDIPKGILSFHDRVLGPQTCDWPDLGGDFSLRRSDGVWAYQLAVVVDDALMGVTSIVRGEDIAASTPRQLYLGYLLGYPRPFYAHVPLLHDSQGDRLAKRHEGLSLRSLCLGGTRPETLVGWLAFQAGLAESCAALSARELAASLRRRHGGVMPWEALPRGTITVPDDLGAQLAALH